MKATRFLAELEGGEERFALYDVARMWTEREDIAELFKAEVGREFLKERAVARGMIDAIYVPTHHNLHWEGYHEEISALDQPAADFIRTVMWSFLMAWSHRFGAISGDIVTMGVLVDPSLRDPPK
jgi:hypothetical protein